MYNPINMVVEDENRLKDKDQREKNKKKRFEARYVSEQATREETLAEKERLDKMSLQKVSHQRVAEEINRGFDILTNGQLRGGLAKIEATTYMKSQPKVWDRITPSNAQAAQLAESAAANEMSLDFEAKSFERRSRRLNTNMARQPEATVAEQVSS